MKVLVVGKFPPIQGGVSAQTHWFANQLADRGHRVSVVTNAREVEHAYRLFMRPDDWARCENRADGNLRVYWTAPLDASQSHIPFGNPFVTKLVSLGLQAARENGADVVFSFYLEPYAVAGHLIAQELGIPHVVKTAGSDVGRLWAHPQYKPFYDQIFRRAAAIWTVPSVRKMLIEEHGLNPDTVSLGGGFVVPDSLFGPSGEVLDLTSLVDALKQDSNWRGPSVVGTPRSDLRYFGIYGKIASDKGVYELIEALGTIRDTDAGLLLMGNAYDRQIARLGTELKRAGMEDRVVHIPFLPHWYVPQFIRRCFAVCCLERDFPIEIHSPVIALEVMACGGCLVGSTEILRKMPQAERLIDGYNCVAIENVKDVAILSQRLKAMVCEPGRADAVRGRTSEYTDAIKGAYDSGATIERLLTRAFGGKIEKESESRKEKPPSWLRIIELVHEKLAKIWPQLLDLLSHPTDYKLWASEFLSKMADRQIAEVEIRSYQDVLKICLLLSDFSSGEARPSVEKFSQLIYRLRQESWAITDDEMSSLSDFEPAVIGEVIVEKFDTDASQALASIRSGELPQAFDRRETYLIIQSEVGVLEPRVFVVDKMSAQVLSELIDRAYPTREADKTSAGSGDESRLPPIRSDSIKAFFELGLIGLVSTSQKFPSSKAAADHSNIV